VAQRRRERDVRPEIFIATPMRRHWFYILLSLAERDRHGSAIMRDVLQLTDGELHLWPASLYGSLDELSQQGWIQEAPKQVGGGSRGRGRRRRFRVTAEGRRALAAEVDRLGSVLQTAERRLSAAAGAS
jgi:DNA-binding PadR family transcriptional regulator